ncbi:MAG: hypothetical protein ACJAZO_003623 [Myxococcota bacterium]
MRVNDTVRQELAGFDREGRALAYEMGDQMTPNRCEASSRVRWEWRSRCSPVLFRSGASKTRRGLDRGRAELGWPWNTVSYALRSMAATLTATVDGQGPIERRFWLGSISLKTRMLAGEPTTRVSDSTSGPARNRYVSRDEPVKARSKSPPFSWGKVLTFSDSQTVLSNGGNGFPFPAECHEGVE